MTPFERAFTLTVGQEAGFTADPRDKGNWTGGEVGAGQCKGTKFGVSAASYPKEDIAGLTLDRARAIYLRDYWSPIRGDELPLGLALLTFDAAVNNGVGQARLWLQAAARVKADGVLGPASLGAIKAAKPSAIMAEFQAQRMNTMGGLETWRTFGLGWSRRLCTMLLEAGAA